jgi:hypothetical protein
VKQVMIKSEGEAQVAARNARLAFKGNKNRHYELLETEYSKSYELPHKRCAYCWQAHNGAWWCAENCIWNWWPSQRRGHPGCKCQRCKKSPIISIQI